MDLDHRDLRIRPARADEAELLTGIAHRAKAHWGYSPELIATWRAALTLTPHDIALYRVALASSANAVTGFYALETSTVPDALWSLMHFWIDPPWHGKGIGRNLFEHAARAVREGSGGGLLIESDPHATTFYQRLGARLVGSVPAPVAGDPSRRLPVLSYTLDDR
jgi:GNAT superfamily N-acetyltransferase